MSEKVPSILLFGFKRAVLQGRKYLSDLDFIKEHLAVDYVAIAPRSGMRLHDLRQCHEPFREFVSHAHEIGLKVALHLVTHEGFYNAAFQTSNHPAVDGAEVFPIFDREKAEAITHDIELTLDENGRASYVHHACWARSKLLPIYAEIPCAYLFDKCGDGFYEPNSLREVTDSVRIIDAHTGTTEFEIDLGRENAGKTLFVILAQYHNFNAVSTEFESFKKMIDGYADIPFDGVMLDEYGYLLLNTLAIRNGEEPPFRGRMYSKGAKEYYQNELGLNLDRLLFDMRYAPKGDEAIRIHAINTYFEAHRHFPIDVERKVADYAKKVFGEDIYIGCHNTFHNRLDGDEIWHTACAWWDVPRKHGHTDENIGYPVRFGLMLACQNPLTIDMFYSRVGEEPHYRHMIEGAPFNCREFHHSYGDFYWGNSFTEPAFLEKIKKLETHIGALDSFQSVYPKMDMLVIFGAAAQNNWYPNEEARNVWDIDGSLHIQDICDEMWKEGYRLALAPDYAIEDGRITQKDGKIYFGGQAFTHCIFLYPKYAKKETYAFLNEAHANGVKVAAVGTQGIDFEGKPVSLTAPHFDAFDLSIPEAIACPKSAIEGGCVYNDGSFSLVSDGILTGEETEFDFLINGIRYSGRHTGVLAYRNEKENMASDGSLLYINGEKAALLPLPL